MKTTPEIISIDPATEEENGRTIAVNQAVASIVECPWGGVGGSGIGRMLGPEAVREFTETVNHRSPLRIPLDLTPNIDDK